MKYFIAINLPKNVKTRIFHESKKLQRENLFNGSFTKKENLHLTLKFLGNLTDKEVEEIKEKLRKINFNKFFCKVEKAGFFYKRKKIRIIWINLLSNKLKELQKKIEKTILEPGENKIFNSHVTIARVKRMRNKQKLVEKINQINFKKLNFKVKEFVLMKSEPSKQGRRYMVLEKFNTSS